MTRTQQPFVSRQGELARLDELLDLARKGQGGVCLVSGEAGSGKSMLVREFVRQAQDEHSDVLVALGDCNAQTGEGHPYLPFREILAQLAGDIDEVGAGSVIGEEGARRLREFGGIGREAITEIGIDLIGAVIPGASVIARLGARLLGSSPRDAQHHARALVEQYTGVVERLSSHRTLVLVVDDLHWADGPSIELLFHLARRIQHDRVLLMGTYRPTEVALGRGLSRHPLESVLAELKRYFGDTNLRLDRGARGDGRDFVDALIDSEPNTLGESFRASVFKHTEGHPLFTVELLRAFQRQEVLTLRDGQWCLATSPKWMQLPSRVEGVIEQQIGRLDDELRGVLRVASVMGETFTLEVVASVLRADKRSVEARINRDLERRHQLVNAHGIQRIGNLRVSQYRFRHSLFQTYLYNELNANERSNLHGEVALALEDLYGERSEDVAVQLARHFDIAGDDAPAARYLKLAGDDALRVYAYAEARAYYQSALDALGRLPDNEASRTQRVAATVALVRSAYVSDPPPTNMERLQEIEPVAAGLAEPSGGGGGDVQPLAWVHYWMGRLGFMMNEPAKAIGYYQQVQAVADQLEDPELLANPASMIGRAFVSQGRLAEAEPLLRQAVGPLEAQGNIAEWIMTTGYLGMSIAGRGAYEEALATAARGLARARQVDSPMGIGLSHVYQWYIHFLGGRVDRMRESAAAAVATAREAGDLMIEYVGLGMHAWAASRAGRPHEAERLMDECQRLGKSLGDRLVVADWFAAARVDIELALGRPEEACRRAEQAVELAKRMGGVYAEGFAERAWAQALAVTNESGPGAVDGHFAASLKAFQAGEILPEVARSRVAWAEVLNRRGDRDAAEEQLRAAEALLEEIGLDTELGEVRTLLSGAT